ncbi:hypothetical protein NIES4071_16410 [Calothrix sp. NIES-4071]|nr:hypothetical protein NIES4071_16410 [Calothrix sp. NIES-4071]BAZ55975.1 hypothetical protein NIES4105_16360 [Calothrix sp. NIES-4105]
MVSTTESAETRTVLENISWQTFKAVLAEMGQSRVNRIAYSDGLLEIMTPLMPHESSNRIIEGFVLVLCEEFGFEVKSTGSTTLTRDDLEKGGEPDSSYYIQNEQMVRGRENINLDEDPPPDLVLEIEYSRSRVDKLSLYAKMRIPEFWRFNGTTLRVYVLKGLHYEEVQISPTFEPVPVKEIPRFVTESKTIGQLMAKKAFREWVANYIQG